jgi:Uncharacterised nucleotidyltransferase
MSPVENQTLALAAALDPSKSGRIPVDRRLIEQAMREGVAGILYKSLLASGRFESLDEVHRNSLQSYYYQTIRVNLQLIHALKEVLHLASQRGLAVVLLQGVDLLHSVYDDLGLRPMMDIDLWVSKNDYDELARVLTQLGYDRDPVYPNTYRRRSIVLDIHTHILWADRIRARKLLLGKSEEHLIETVRAIEIEGEKALCLSPYDQVLYLTLHAFKHRVDRLIWLVDIKRILEHWKTAEWERLVRRAEDLGQAKSLLYIIFLLDQGFHFRISQDAVELLQKKSLGPLEKEILRRRVKKGSLPIWGPLLLFSSQLGPGKRLAFFFESLFPRTEVLRQVFPSPPDLKPWQLYGKRALQLLGMLERAIRSA